MASRLLIAVLAILPLAACNAWQDRAEFAAPQDRWTANLPSPVPANAAPPPIQVRYCYRTLANVDCFAEAKPGRIAGYTGVYPNPESFYPYAKVVSEAAPQGGTPAPTQKP